MTERKHIGPYTVAASDRGGFEVLLTLMGSIVDGPFPTEDEAVSVAENYTRMLRMEDRSRRRQRGATRLY